MTAHPSPRPDLPTDPGPAAAVPAEPVPAGSVPDAGRNPAANSVPSTTSTPAADAVPHVTPGPHVTPSPTPVPHVTPVPHLTPSAAPLPHPTPSPAPGAPPARVVVTRAIPRVALDLLGPAWVSPFDRPLTPGELRDAVRGATAIVAMLHDRVDDSMLDAAGGGLRIVANVAVGYDNIDVAACAARGVLVTNTPDVLVDATADLTMALLLGITRRVGEGDRLLRAGTPWSWAMDFMVGTGLQGLRLGIVGFGRIGRAVARRATAFGMEVVHARPPGRQPAPHGTSRAEPATAGPRDDDAAARPPGDDAAIAGAVSWDELLGTSDVVSLHCPLTPLTRHLIDAAALRAMRPSAYLVNTARGPIVDEAALADALARGAIRGAALDVFEREPLVEPRLRDLDNVLMTPHLGSATSQTREAMAVLAVRNVISVLSGGSPLTPVS